ncbi:SRPBCC family protein [Flavobacterium silvaticum]|uniref:SRPBCC domain-containing protein n=1 Tax=Flavobacterium silvaticum TaxID=1852020 RepID=A0A972FTC0_9FLAO|nr:SRPBCC domain-containing protein [Flavobacterium silvaticum]NMH28118.1 SRPBCC domain-containing protein [Flavobacterium silvaticum]
MHESEKKPLILERIYDSPVSEVWQALTDVSKMKQWYFPMLEDFKPEVGFTTEFTVPHPNGNQYVHRWTVTEAVPQKTIAYDWKYPDYEGMGNVRYDLEEADGKTKLTLTFRILESFDPDKFPELSMKNFTEGWTYFVKAIEDYLKK